MPSEANSPLQPRFGDAHEMFPQGAIARDGRPAIPPWRGGPRPAAPDRPCRPPKPPDKASSRSSHRHRRLLRVRTFESGVEIERRDAFDPPPPRSAAPSAGPNRPDGCRLTTFQHWRGTGAAGNRRSPTNADAPHAWAWRHWGRRNRSGRSCRSARPAFGCGDGGIERCVGQVQIDEARARDLDLGKSGIGFQPRRDLLRQRPGIGFGLLGPPPARHCIGIAPGPDDPRPGPDQNSGRVLRRQKRQPAARDRSAASEVMGRNGPSSCCNPLARTSSGIPPSNWYS